MKRLLKKSVWGIPLWIFPTMVAIAWTGYMLLIGTQSAEFNVAVGPQAPDLEVLSYDCLISSGHAGIPTASLDGFDLSCQVDEFDDTTLGYMIYLIQNNDPVRSVSYDRVVPASDPCVALGFSPATLSGTIAPSGSLAFSLNFTAVPGEAGTVTCAGTTIGPFVYEIDFAIIP